MTRTRRIVAAVLMVAIGITSLPSQDVVEAAPAPRQIQPQEPGRFGITQNHVNLWPRYERQRVVVQIYGTNFRHKRLNGVDLWLGVRHGPDRVWKPEYRVSWLLPKDGDGIKGLWLHKVGGFADTSPRFVRCPRKYARKHLKRGYVELSVPWRCLGGMNEVRINATTWDFTRYNNSGRPTRGYHHSTPKYKELTRRMF